MSLQPSTRMLQLGDGRPEIQVFEAGEGMPLLFLHGAGGIGKWTGALALLANTFRVYAPLLPGFGHSTGLELIDDQLDLVLHQFDVIDALGLERPYVVGESVGGWLAAEMATLRPNALRRLALIAPLGLWRDEAPLADMFGTMTEELVPYLFHDVGCDAAQDMLSLRHLLSDKDDRTEAQVETLLAMSRAARTIAKFLFPIPATTLEQRLWRITAPTLILWGADDRFAPPLYADAFAQKIRGAHVVLVPRAGHLVTLEQPHAVNDAVNAWARKSL